MEKKDIKEVQQLISLGKEKGFLTYEEVNDALPDDLVSPEELDDVLSMFDEMDIEVVDDEEEAKTLKKKVAGAEPAAPAEERVALPEEVPEAKVDLEANVKSTDPVRLYLRKMGSVPLLTREGEVEIAKRIEQGEDDVLRTLIQSPLGLGEFLEMGERLSRGKTRVAELVKDFDDIEESEALDESEYRLKVLKLMSRVRTAAAAYRKKMERSRNERLRKENRQAAVQDSVGAREEILSALKDMRLNTKTITALIGRLSSLEEVINEQDPVVAVLRRKLEGTEEQMGSIIARYRRSP